MASIGPPGASARRQAHDAVPPRLLPRHGLHRHEAVTIGLEAPHHLFRATGAVAVDKIVGKQYREGLVADRRPRAQHRVPEPERRRLANVHARHVGRENRAHACEKLGPALRFERRLQLRRAVEVILDRLLRGPGDEHEVIDPGRHRLLHRVLDEGLVDDREHLLRECLGRGQEPGAQPRHREDRLSNPLRHLRTSPVEVTRPADGGSRHRRVLRCGRMSARLPPHRKSRRGARQASSTSPADRRAAAARSTARTLSRLSAGVST